MMGKVIMSGIVPQLVAPVTGIALADIAEGSLVKLNESGNPVEFYVAKHDYESGLNGAGRTLLVRKDCYDRRQWHSSKVNAYASSAIDSWLNSTYKGLLDEVAQAAIGETTFYYTPGGGTSGYHTTVTTLSRCAFLLSVAELGLSSSAENSEGTTLPIASTLKIAYLDGAPTMQWTRTPVTTSTENVFCVNGSGGLYGNSCGNSRGSRPCFTLPETALFDEKTLLFKGVS